MAMPGASPLPRQQAQTGLPVLPTACAAFGARVISSHPGSHKPIDREGMGSPAENALSG